MQKKWSLIRIGFFLAALTLPGTFAMPHADAQPVVATDTLPTGTGTSASSKTVEMAAPEKDSTDQYTQNSDSRSLEEQIAIFNRDFCPPETPITEISEFSLVRLIKAELIKRSDFEKYQNMIMVNGKVYVKDEKPDDKPDQKPVDKTGNNLFTSLEAACEQLKQKQTRGVSEGNKKPERVLEFKRRKIVYRDRENQLHEMEIYSPPRFPAKKKALKGKKGKLVKDYATSVLLPKNQQGKSSDLTAFDDMPSADSWLEEGDGKTQK